MKKLIYSQEDLDLILCLKLEEKDKEIERLKEVIQKNDKDIDNLCKNQKKEIQRLNKGYNELEKYFTKPNKFIERPERMKILDKIKELKEGK